MWSDWTWTEDARHATDIIRLPIHEQYLTDMNRLFQFLEEQPTRKDNKDTKD